jgi:hypothetical protein
LMDRSNRAGAMVPITLRIKDRNFRMVLGVG